MKCGEQSDWGESNNDEIVWARGITGLVGLGL